MEDFLAAAEEGPESSDGAGVPVMGVEVDVSEGTDGWAEADEGAFADEGPGPRDEADDVEGGPESANGVGG